MSDDTFEIDVEAFAKALQYRPPRAGTQSLAGTRSGAGVSVCLSQCSDGSEQSWRERHPDCVCRWSERLSGRRQKGDLHDQCGGGCAPPVPKADENQRRLCQRERLVELLYASILKASEKWTHPTKSRREQSWNLTLSQLSIHFEWPD